MKMQLIQQVEMLSVRHFALHEQLELAKVFRTTEWDKSSGKSYVA